MEKQEKQKLINEVKSLLSEVNEGLPKLESKLQNFGNEVLELKNDMQATLQKTKTLKKEKI